MKMRDAIHAPCNEYDPEEPVIEAIAQRDRFAFEEFVRRNSGWVRSVAFGVLGNAEDLDDVCQCIWKNVWNKTQTITETSKWKSWLYIIARNVAVDSGRERTRRRRMASRLLSESNGPASAGSASERAIREERKAVVFDAIARLPALYREPFVLRHLEEMSYKQISDVMSLPVDTVETRLVRARRMLRDALRGEV